MDKFTKFTLVFLSAQLFVMGLLVSHLAYKLGYEQGRASLYAPLVDNGEVVGTCLVPSGCEDYKQTQEGHSNAKNRQTVKRH